MSSKAREALWQQLNADEAAQFLRAVASPDEPVIFDASLCEVHKMPLSFYDDYFLTRIVNKQMLPYLLLDFLSNGEKHYYLDGSDQAFHNLNSQGAISLDKDNVIDYVDLYISYVYERGNSLAFISDPHATSHKGSAAMEMHFRAITHHQQSSVKFDDASQRFHIVTPLIYQDQTIQSRVEIDKTGSIHLIEPVAVSFLTKLKPAKHIAYRHPLEDSIIEQSRALLSTTATGQKLIQATIEKGVEVRVLNSPSRHSYTTNTPVVYLVMPSVKRTADYLQAIVLAGGLRDAEQVLKEYYHPHPVHDEDRFFELNYSKNLDIVVEMCKIVKEYEDQNIQDALNELRKIGLESVYSGYKNGLSSEALMTVYIDSLKRYGLLTEED